MKLKKSSITKRVFITVITAIIFTVTILVKLPSFAETSQSANSNVLYLKLNEFMTQNTPHMGYAIGDPGTNGSEGNAHHIWNIIQTTKQEAEASTLLQQRRIGIMELVNVLKTNNITAASAANTNQNIYCVNAEIGFNNVDSTATYDASYDMLTQRNEIVTKLKSLDYEIPVDEKNSKGTEIKEYDALLALLDMLYLNDNEDKDVAEAEKIEFLKQAGIKWSEGMGCYWCQDGTETYECHVLLTNDDIKAVQQAAIWYFTNYYETKTTTQLSASSQEHYEKYDKTGNHAWLNYKLEGENNEYKSLSDYHPNGNSAEGKDRQEEAEVLYKYLINTAKEKANEYSNVGISTKADEEKAPVNLETEELDYKAEEDNYIIGPIKLTNNESNNALYTLTMTVKNGENTVEASQYELLDKNQAKVENKDIKNLVGQDFYISIPKTSANNTVTVNFEIKYDSKKLTLWTSQNNETSTQPVVIPENKEHTVTKKLEVQPKEFDLALRKYITKVGETELSQENTRAPNIDTTKLANKSDTTAEYKHRKDPVEVTNGSEVTYKITIYNEGEKKGKATKVVDQLPTGLKFKALTEDTNGTYTEDYDATSNKVTFNLVNGKGELHPYSTSDSNNLSSTTITFICEVTAKAGATDKILTN